MKVVLGERHGVAVVIITVAVTYTCPHMDTGR